LAIAGALHAAGFRELVPLQIGSWFEALKLLQVEAIYQAGVGVT
jgi:hypothetical protein